MQILNVQSGFLNGISPDEKSCFLVLVCVFGGFGPKHWREKQNKGISSG